MNNLTCFVDWQRDLEEKQILQGNLLVAYVLEANYDSFTLSTNTALQQEAGPLSRGSFLLAASEPGYVVLLRVQETVASPLRSLENMTLYELGKRSMPSLDQLTTTDMSWTCLRCDVLGAFYELEGNVYFAGDLPKLSAASDYRVYTPGPLLPLIVNGEYGRENGDGIYRAAEYASGGSTFVPAQNFSPIGTYRPTEFLCASQYNPPVNLYLWDIAGRRTALFGKTRSGKSNTVKMIATAMLTSSLSERNLGQLIIDTNGEYANDNPQDGRCLCSRFPAKCVVYSVVPKPGSGARVLKSNFYQNPSQAMTVFAENLSDSKATYVKAFLATPIPSLEEIRSLPHGGERIRGMRRIQMFWVALYKAGFQVDESRLEGLAPKTGKSVFDPGFSADLREQTRGKSVPSPSSLRELSTELEKLYRFSQKDPQSKLLQSASGNPILTTDDKNLLEFLFPSGNSSGVKVLSSCRVFHDKDAGDILSEIPELLDQSKTVILDLANGTPTLIRYLTDQICGKVFRHQEDLFTRNALGDHHVQIYAEEAHNYFPSKDTENTGIYARIAKEGAKYNIGLIYSTQSPSTISGELLSQTENFVVAHLDSAHEMDALVKRSAPFAGVRESILKTRTPGYVHLLTASQRYPVPVQISSFREMEVV